MALAKTSGPFKPPGASSNASTMDSATTNIAAIATTSPARTTPSSALAWLPSHA